MADEGHRAAKTVQLHTLMKEVFQDCFKVNNGVSVLEAPGYCLKEINGNMSFTVMQFLKN